MRRLMTERSTQRTRELTPLVSSLGVACLSLLGGCASESGGSGGGGTNTGPLAVTSQNAETLASAAIVVATIGDSLPFTASRYGASSGQGVPCDNGTLDISASTGSSTDTVTTPSGNVISPPAAGDTVLDYAACEESGYTNDGRAAVGASGNGSRVRWLNLRIEHTLIAPSNVVGAAIFSNAGQILYRIDDLTVTQGSSSFYAIGQIDSFDFARQLRFDVQLRFPDGSAQITSPQRLTGTQGMPFDGGELLIEGENSSVTVLPLGGGMYRLEIDTNGDDVADTVMDAVSL